MKYCKHVSPGEHFPFPVKTVGTATFFLNLENQSLWQVCGGAPLLVLRDHPGGNSQHHHGRLHGHHPRTVQNSIHDLAVCQLILIDVQIENHRRHKHRTLNDSTNVYSYYRLV